MSPKSTQERLWCPTCQSVFRSSFMRCPLDGASLEPLTRDPMVGTTLADRFVIEECIGEGGMGRIYRARHKLMSRRYAIKVLFGDLVADAKMRTRFSQEAEAASRLSHPNVISVTDFGETASRQMYLVMDYIEGTSLRRLIRKEAPFDTMRSAHLLWQMASGLDHAHQKELVHRDFKPDNVIVASEDGVEVPKILDFGIAHITEDGYDNNLTTAGTVMGTPAYMSPEHALGAPLDGRSDLFSLGVVLYQMLSGKLPFDGLGPALVQQNMASPAPSIQERVPGLQVDPDLEAMAHHLMAKQPDQRFQTARELIETLMDRGLIGPDASTSLITPRPTLLRAAADGVLSMSASERPATVPPHAESTQSLHGSSRWPNDQPAAAAEEHDTDPTSRPSEPLSTTRPRQQSHADVVDPQAEYPYQRAPSLANGQVRASSEASMQTHMVSSLADYNVRPRGRGKLVLLALFLASAMGLLVFFLLDRMGKGNAGPVDADAGLVIDDMRDASPGPTIGDASIADAAELDSMDDTDQLDADVPDARPRKDPRNTATRAEFKARYNEVAGLVDRLVKKRPNDRATIKIDKDFSKINYLESMNDKAKRKTAYAKLARLRTRIRKELRR